MRDFGDDDVPPLEVGRLGENLARIGITLPFVRARRGAELERIGYTVQGRWNMVIQRDGFQLMDSFKLVIELAAQILTLRGIQLQRGQLNQMFEGLGVDFVSHISLDHGVADGVTVDVGIRV